VAIIGIGCRFPGASSPEGFWQLLRDGIDVIKEVPKDRFDIDVIYDPRPGIPGKLASRQGGFLDDVDKFDADFFAISPREAIVMDPQQRLALEVAWEAIEDAGLPIDRLTRSRTGVYMGACFGDYENVLYRNPSGLNIYSVVGTLRSAVPGRISYALGLDGPSILIDAGCASSLVAVHLAFQGIQNGECEMALAGGTNLILTPHTSIAFSQAGMMAPDGRCKSFDAGADGFVRSDGVGAVVIKPLSLALADGDPIYATILGTAVNDDGQGNGLFFSPSLEGHGAVLKDAYRAAAVSPASIQYVETHGTGTKVGDPIEAGALGAFFSEGRPSDRPLVLGSVKSNIGHTEGAAGIAGLIKVALSLKHRQIPPSLHVLRLNPEIPWSELRLTVQKELGAWPVKPEEVARAGVSSLGISGTNSHAVLEEPPRISSHAQLDVETGDRKLLLALSARSPSALKAMAEKYRSFLLPEESASRSLYDICYTAGARRSHHRYRLATIGDSRAAHAAQLEMFLRDEASSEMVSGEAASGERRKIAFVFSGHGAQWLGMGRRLLKQEPVFASIIEECARLMAHYVDWSLLDELNADEVGSRLNRNDVIQPAIFAIQVALAGLWRWWGIEPDAVIGHSMGEVAAAHVAGALNLAEACHLICVRSLLLDRLRGQGSMAMVELTIDQTRKLLAGYEDRVSIAASNSPRATVLSGESAALQKIAAMLESRDLYCRFLKVDGAGHSPQVEPLCQELVRALCDLKPKSAKVPIYSCVTREAIEGERFDATYWAANLRKTVLFSDAIDRMRRDGFDLFLELAPHPILQVPIKQVFQHAGADCDSVASIRRNEDECATMLSGLGSMYTLGQTVDWNRFYARRGQCIQLPAYPWQRERFWVDLDGAAHDQAEWQSIFQASDRLAHPLLGSHVESPVHPGLHLWEHELSLSRLSYLDDNRLQNRVMFPATAYLEIAKAGMAQVFGGRPYLIEDVEFGQLLFLPESGRQKTQLAILPETPESHCFKYFGLGEGAEGSSSWTLYASGKIRPTETRASEAAASTPSEIQRQCLDAVPAIEFYGEMRERNVRHGQSFQGVTEIWRRDGAALARIETPEAVAPQASRYGIHPAVLDACLQVAMAALPLDDRMADPDMIYTPAALRRLKVDAALPLKFWSYVSIHSDSDRNPETIECDISLFGDDDQLLTRLEGLRLRRLITGSMNPAPLDDLIYERRWEPSPAQPVLNRNENPDGTWLIFADSKGFGHRLASLLTSSGQTCITVSSGASYLCKSLTEYEINLSSREDFQRFFRGLATPSPCRGIVYLWSCDGTLDSFEMEPDLGCGSVLYLIQAIAETGWSERPCLRLVTNGAQSVEGTTEPPAIAQAPILGLGLVIAREHPEFRCKVIDLGSDDVEDGARQLSAELLHEDEEIGIVLRGGARYVPRLTHSSRHLTAAPSSEENGARLEPDEPEEKLFRPDVTYLISGGLGGLGLAITKWMAAKGARCLALAGRSAPSAKAEQIISELRAHGVTILTRQVDVSSPKQTATLIGEIRQTLPPLRGIMHLAAAFKHNVLLRLDLESFNAVMAPKAKGAWNLHSLTLDQPLDFFVLFSSATSLLGSPAHANYVAANSFLDALAYYRRAEGLPALSINWGAWAAASPLASSKFRKLLAERGLYSITPEQGLLALEKCMRQKLTQIACMNLDAERWSQYSANGASDLLLSNLISKPGETEGQTGPRLSLKESLTAEPEVSRRRAMIEFFLKEQLAKVFKTSPDRINSTDPLNRQGLDSLMSIELRNRLESQLGIALSPLLTWKYPTIASMVAHLAGKMDVPIETEASPALPQASESDLVLAQLRLLSENDLGAELAARLQMLDET